MTLPRIRLTIPIAAATVVVTGPALSAGLYFVYIVSTASDITVAALGLVGTLVSSGTALYITVRTHRGMRDTNDRVQSVERKVSAPRRISATAGDSDDAGVVVQPPEVEE